MIEIIKAIVYMDGCMFFDTVSRKKYRSFRSTILMAFIRGFKLLNCTHRIVTGERLI